MDAPLDIVVVGGPGWGPGINQPAVQTVRALSAEHRVLYLCEDSQGSTLGRLLARRNGPSSVWSTVKDANLSQAFIPMTARRLDDRLWVAPLRGLTRLLPLSYPEPVRSRTAARLGRFIGREMEHIGIRRPVLWFYWWFFPELMALPHSVSLYDNTDAHDAYDHNRRWRSVRGRTVTLEHRLLGAVDLAYALSPELANRLRAVHSQMRLEAPGIDAGAVTAALAESERPRDVVTLEHPLIGYAGHIGGRLDWDLILGLADLRPEWTFVFVGGPRPPGLATRANVHFRPSRPYPEIMRAIREFDVGIVPWLDSPATRGAYSYKALDYLAAGKQVVATALPFSRDLSMRYPTLVTTARSQTDWDVTLARALTAARQSQTAARCAAAAHSRTTLTRTEAILGDVRNAMTGVGNGVPLPRSGNRARNRLS